MIKTCTICGHDFKTYSGALKRCIDCRYTTGWKIPSIKQIEEDREFNQKYYKLLKEDENYI